MAQRIAFRPLSLADIPAIIRWQQAPHAVRWFAHDPTDPALAEQEFGPCIDGTEPTRVHVIQIDGVDVGYMQHYLVSSYDDYLAAVGDDRAAAIDYVIGEISYVGKGLGPRVIEQYVREMVLPSYPEIQRVVSTPDLRNERSIRALEKAGFRRLRAIEVAGQTELLCVLGVR